MMNKGVVYALWAYEAQNSDELTFREGDALTILRRKDEVETDWWWARLGDREGYVPRNLLGVRPRWGPPTAQTPGARLPFSRLPGSRGEWGGSGGICSGGGLWGGWSPSMRAAHSVFCSRGPQAAPSAPMAPQALGLPLLSAPRPVGWQLLSSCSHWTPVPSALKEKGTGPLGVSRVSPEGGGL